MRDHLDYALLGRTRDDAAGEAFDKAARILGLGYPGGPAIEKAAREGIASIKLPRAWLKGTNDFSFSGLKTALLRLAEGGKVSTMADAASSFQEAAIDAPSTKTVDGSKVSTVADAAASFQEAAIDAPSTKTVDGSKVSTVADAAASFQEAAIDVLVTKTVATAKEHRVKQILLAGGVAANSLLRQRLKENSPIPVLVPEPILCTDNAAMVAASGYYQFQAGKTSGLDLDVAPSLKIA
jgi:N6-L-threonylcarbamoyladenine synthase